MEFPKVGQVWKSKNGALLEVIGIDKMQKTVAWRHTEGSSFPLRSGQSSLDDWDGWVGCVSAICAEDVPDTKNDAPLPSTIDTQGVALRDYLAAHASESTIAKFVGRYMEVARINEPEEWGDNSLWYSSWHMERIAKIEARYRYALADAMMKNQSTGEMI